MEKLTWLDKYENETPIKDLTTSHICLTLNAFLVKGYRLYDQYDELIAMHKELGKRLRKEISARIRYDVEDTPLGD